MQTSTIALHIPQEVQLPDKGTWKNRFEIRSETSNRVYIVSQHKDKLHWACSCPGWCIHRRCKHLAAIGLPAHEIPYEPKITN